MRASSPGLRCADAHGTRCGVGCRRERGPLARIRAARRGSSTPAAAGATSDRSRCVQHMQKALTEMNVQLDNVLSDIMGVTGQWIVLAMVAGERDGTVLAQ